MKCRHDRPFVVPTFALATCLAIASTLTGTASTSTVAQDTVQVRRPDVVYVPTPQEVVDRMLELAELKKGEVLYDLGCGDGRIVITAAKRYGVKAVGFDIDPKRVAESRQNVQKAGVGELVTIKQQDIFTTDLTGADVVTLYLLPTLNVRLMPQLAKLKPGSRILSHAFNMKGARPKKLERVHCGDGATRNLFLWLVPWDKDGP
jgi:ribosomal protein L11 methylase PrmA